MLCFCDTIIYPWHSLLVVGRPRICDKILGQHLKKQTGRKALNFDTGRKEQTKRKSKKQRSSLSNERLQRTSVFVAITSPPLLLVKKNS